HTAPRSGRDRSRAARLLERSVHPAVEAEHDPIAGVWDQIHAAPLAWLEPDGGARRNIQSPTIGHWPVELEGRVDLEEVKVGTDLDGPVAGVQDVDGGGRPPRVQDERAMQWDQFPGRHGIGSCTVTSLVPSGNVASTWTSAIISGTPSITSSRRRIC